MKEKVEILNASLYKKKDNSYGTVLHYRILSPDYIMETKYSKGYPELSLFTSNDELFNLLQAEDFGVGCEIEYETKKDYRNPLNTINRGSKLKIGSSTFNLL